RVGRTRGDRPVRGGARDRDARAAALGPPGPLDPRCTVGGPDRRRPRRPGPRRRSDRRRAAGRPGHRVAAHPAHRGCRAGGGRGGPRGDGRRCDLRADPRGGPGAARWCRRRGRRGRRRAGRGDRATGGPMSSVLLTGIGELVTNDPSLGDGGPLGVVTDAALVAEGGRVVWVGTAREAPPADAAQDVGGRAVIPGFVDSHSHLVFAGDRAAEFAARMSGQPYTAGGIRSTVAATRAATDEQLGATLTRLVAEMRRQGTTTVEVKSG